MSVNYQHLFKKGINTFTIQGVSILLTLILNWYLAITLKADLYGIFTYAFSWVYFFGSLSTLGMSGVILRKTIQYKTQKAYGLIRGSFQFANRLTFGTTLFLVICFVSVLYWILPVFSPIENPLIPTALFLGILALPVYSQLLLRQTACISLKKIEYGLLPEKIIRPLLFLIFLFIGNYYLQGIGLNESIQLNLIAFLIAFLTASYFLKSIIRLDAASSKEDQKEWIKLGTTFFLLYVIGSINARADILMLGFFGLTEKVGIYNIAVKIAQFIAMPLMLSNNIIAPYIAQMFDHQKKQLSRLIKKVIRIVFLIGSIGFIIFYFFGRHLLSYFGEEFEAGYFALMIIASAQMFNLFVGPVGNILTMSKFENIALKGMAGSAVINIVLNLVLIPLYGIDGAAIATFTGLVYWNIILFIAVYKKTGINASVI